MREEDRFKDRALRMRETLDRMRAQVAIGLSELERLEALATADPSKAFVQLCFSPDLGPIRIWGVMYGEGDR